MRNDADISHKALASGSVLPPFRIASAGAAVMAALACYTADMKAKLPMKEADLYPDAWQRFERAVDVV